MIPERADSPDLGAYFPSLLFSSVARAGSGEDALQILGHPDHDQLHQVMKAARSAFLSRSKNLTADFITEDLAVKVREVLDRPGKL